SDDPLANLKTPERCEQFARNVEDKKPDLAKAARRKAVQLLARAEGTASDVEVAAYEAVHAYERALNVGRGRRVRASRTWQLIEREGILEAVDRIVSRPSASQGYRVLVEMGLEDMAFENLVLSFSGSFSAAAVERAQSRIQERSAG